MFGSKTPQDPELIRILGSEVAGQPTKGELKELARCEPAVVQSIGDEKPLVLLSDPGVGVVVVTDAAVTSVDSSGPKLRLTYPDIVETMILTHGNGATVVFESRHARENYTDQDVARLPHVIQAGVPSLEIAQRVCSTIDPKLNVGPKKRRK